MPPAAMREIRSNERIYGGWMTRGELAEGLGMSKYAVAGIERSLSGDTP